MLKRPKAGARLYSRHDFMTDLVKKSIRLIFLELLGLESIGR